MSGQLRVDELSSSTGNITISNSQYLDLSDSVAGLPVPIGDTSAAGTPNKSALRYDSTTEKLVGYGSGGWDGFTGSTVEDSQVDEYVQTGLFIHLDCLHPDSWINDNGYNNAKQWKDLSGYGNHWTVASSLPSSLTTDKESHYALPVVDETRKCVSFLSNYGHYAKSNNKIDLSDTYVFTAEFGVGLDDYRSNAMVVEHSLNWNTNFTNGSWGFFLNSQGGYSSGLSTKDWIHINGTNSRVDVKTFDDWTSQIKWYTVVYEIGKKTEVYASDKDRQPSRLITENGTSVKTNTNSFGNDFEFINTRGETLVRYIQEQPFPELKFQYYRLYKRRLTYDEMLTNWQVNKRRFSVGGYK